MHARKQLTFFVVPRSGPVRTLETLGDATQALLNDLPYGMRKPPHWLEAGRLVLRATETGLPADIRAATEALLRAIVHEGWMERGDRGAITEATTG